MRVRMPCRSRIGSALFAGCVTMFVIGLASTACVHVPENVRAQFAPPEPADRSNFRHGAHGKALPLEEPAAKAASEAVQANDAGAGVGNDAPSGDGGVVPSSPDGGDGGVDQGGAS